MSILLIKHVDKLKKLILEVGAMVEKALQQAITAIQTRDIDLAKKVIEQDSDIDLKEIDVEEECLATLAMHQPVAHDLRFIVAVLKINRDLERIGDQAVNMAEQAIALAGHPQTIDVEALDLSEMGRLTQQMLKQSLQALVDLDPVSAQDVRQQDDKVDDIHRQAYATVEKLVREQPDQFPQLIAMLMTARQLERVADHAVNIGEDVIYLTRGQIVRHPGIRDL